MVLANGTPSSVDQSFITGANHPAGVAVDDLGREVPRLTAGQQTPGIQARFRSDVLVAGM